MGIKTHDISFLLVNELSSEKPPHHMGIKTVQMPLVRRPLASEKPPHHMGIKTEYRLCSTWLQL